MIRHVVLVRFEEATPKTDIDAIFADLSRLQQVVPGMRSFAGGVNVSPEGLAKGFTHLFVVEFESAAARDAYLVHPAHRAAGARLVQAAKGGLDGVLVMDF